MTYEDYETKRQMVQRQQEEAKRRAEEAAQQAAVDAARRDAEYRSSRAVAGRIARGTGKTGIWIFATIASLLFLIIELVMIGAGLVVFVNGFVAPFNGLQMVLGLLLIVGALIPNLGRRKFSEMKK